MDLDLVIRAQRGDEEAFASLAVACGDRLHAVAHRILRDEGRRRHVWNPTCGCCTTTSGRRRTHWATSTIAGGFDADGPEAVIEAVDAIVESFEFTPH